MNFWISTDTPLTTTTVKFGKGTAAINATEQTIANINTAPIGVNWFPQGSEPSTPFIGDLEPNQYKSIWVWWNVEAGTGTTKDDTVTFSFSFFITTGGTIPEPPITCPTGQHLSGGVCVPNTTVPPGGCPAGQHEENGLCVPDEVIPPNSTPDFKVAAVGDWGCETMTTTVVNRIVTRGINLVLGTGDNAYAASSCWFTRVKPIDNRQSSTIRFETSMGNHEYEESGGEGPYKTHFGYSKTYFSFQFHNLYVLVLDSNIDMDSGGAQHTFVETDLAQASANPAIQWKFCIFHHPMFGASSTHSYNDGSTVENFMNLFTQNKVSLVMCGHNHNWQRTYPVKRNSSSATSPTPVATGNGPYTVGSPEGWMIHVVSGGGGHDSGGSLYPVGSQPNYQAYQDDTHNGHLEIAFTNNGQKVTCSFISQNGDSLHSWVMNRTPGITPTPGPGPTTGDCFYG